MIRATGLAAATGLGDGGVDGGGFEGKTRVALKHCCMLPHSIIAALNCFDGRSTHQLQQTQSQFCTPLHGQRRDGRTRWRR